MFRARLPIFIFLLTAMACRAAAPTHPAAPTHFDWRRDTIAFSNDTVFSYGIDETGRLTIHRRTTPARFAHRCFVLARAVLQFHNFARFAPDERPLANEDYRRLLLHLFRI